MQQSKNQKHYLVGLRMPSETIKTVSVKAGSEEAAMRRALKFNQSAQYAEWCTESTVGA